MKYIALIGLASAFIACQPGKKSVALSDLKIAYNVYYDTTTGNYEIFVIDSEGKNPRNISNSPGIDWAYYSYRDKIYFASDRDTTYRMYFLYEMDADGKQVRKVTDLRLEDSWMSSRHDGREMIVSGRIGKQIRYQLFLVDLATGNYKQITTDTAASFVDPVFSPDGKQIVFRHRTNRRNFENEKAELWIMNADGTGKSQLTHYPESDTTAEWHSYHAGPPTWEASSNRISFMSFQKGNYSIFTIQPDGSNLQQLTPDSLGEGWHAWSPGGDWIVYDVSAPDQTSFDISLMKSDGTDIRTLANDWRTEQAPIFVEVKR